MDDEKKVVPASGEAKFNAIFNASPDAVFIENMNGVILDVNEKGCEFHGLPKEKIVGKNFIEFVPLHHRSKVLSNFENFVQRKKFRLESFATNHKGISIPVEITVSPIIYNQEECIILNMRDISKRYYAEQELRKTNHELQRVSKMLTDSSEKQLKKLAAELHDEIGQLLTALKIEIHQLHKKLDKENHHLSTKAESIKELTQYTLDSLRNISTNLRPAILDKIGLVAALQWLIQQFEQKTEIPVTSNLNIEESDLNENQKIVIYRVLQECLTNIYKHSGATHAVVNINRLNNKLLMIVQDDGTGFKQQDVSTLFGNGIIGIRERVLSVGGRLKINSMPQKGTEIIVNIPI
ncbi:MAG: PAS domain-containing sensor histidine kinase [Bacteroidetes bacterium]|nr:MAG: PAS domain-containing sensor histidine kinase [Bacteroidota bacterium]